MELKEKITFLNELRFVIFKKIIYLLDKIKFTIIDLWEDIRIAVKRDYKSFKFKLAVSKELHKYEHKKYTSPKEHFQMTLASGLLILFIMIILSLLFMVSTYAGPGPEKYVYDSFTQTLIQIRESIFI